MELKLNDFVPSDDDLYKQTFTFDCKQWARTLDHARWGLARERPAAAVKALLKKGGQE
jgi:hypothetical protein